MSTHFTTIDAVIVLMYLVGLSACGYYFARRQVGIEDYLTAKRSMGGLAVGLSLMAAMNSGMDYLMQPWVVAKYGLVGLPTLLSVFAWMPWALKVTMPFYRRLQLYTTYQYLESRFDGKVQSMAAGLFLLARVAWLGTALYVPVLAINAVTGAKIPVSPTIVVLGCLVTLYTAYGGMRTVIWTDVIQCLVMFCGITAAVWVVARSLPGGLGDIWHTTVATGKLNAVSFSIPGTSGLDLWGKFRAFFTSPLTVYGMMIPLLIGEPGGYTTDQVAVQRVQTSKSLKDIKQSMYVVWVSSLIWLLTLWFIGLAVFAYFQHNPWPLEFQNDKMFPYFISVAFPTGFTGIVIAAILAGSLSSIDAALNSCASVLTVDYYLKFRRRRSSNPDHVVDDRTQVRVSRLFTVAVGAIGIIIALNVGRIGDLIEIAGKTIALAGSPLFPIYLLGMFSKRAQTKGVMIGAIAGLAVAIYVAYFTAISFRWPAVFGFFTTLLVGYVASLAMGPAPADKSKFTFREVMKSPEPE